VPCWVFLDLNGAGIVRWHRFAAGVSLWEVRYVELGKSSKAQQGMAYRVPRPEIDEKGGLVEALHDRYTRSR
jgi:hypothetical protein